MFLSVFSSCGSGDVSLHTQDVKEFLTSSSYKYIPGAKLTYRGSEVKPGKSILSYPLNTTFNFNNEEGQKMSGKLWSCGKCLDGDGFQEGWTTKKATSHGPAGCAV